jgi:hypothetical protein
VNEVGRCFCENVVFCLPDDDRKLVTPTGRFSLTDEVTNNLLFEVQFDFEDAGEQFIRELGIFTGTVVAEDIPVGLK